MFRCYCLTPVLVTGIDTPQHTGSAQHGLNWMQDADCSADSSWIIFWTDVLVLFALFQIFALLASSSEVEKI